MPGNSSASNKAQNATKERSNTKRSKGVILDTSTSVTQKVRPKRGHGLNNEGTNINYEEER